MTCPDCHGIGEVLIDGAGNIVVRLRDAVLMVPCPGCGGSGIASCCEGAVGCADDITNKGQEQ